MDEAAQLLVEPEEIKVVSIHSAIASKLNLADFQNAVPIIRELRVVNETANKYSDVTLTLSSSPEAFKLKS